MTVEEKNEEMLGYKNLNFFERISKLTNILDSWIDDELKLFSNLALYRPELKFITDFGNYEQYIPLNNNKDKTQLNLFISRYNIPVEFINNSEPICAIFDMEKPLITFSDKEGKFKVSLDDIVHSINNTGEEYFDLNKALRKFKIADVLDDEQELNFQKV